MFELLLLFFRCCFDMFSDTRVYTESTRATCTPASAPLYSHVALTQPARHYNGSGGAASSAALVSGAARLVRSPEQAQPRPAQRRLDVTA